MCIDEKPSIIIWIIYIKKIKISTKAGKALHRHLDKRVYCVEQVQGSGDENIYGHVISCFSLLVLFLKCILWQLIIADWDVSTAVYNMWWLIIVSLWADSDRLWGVSSNYEMVTKWQSL